MDNQNIKNQNIKNQNMNDYSEKKYISELYFKLYSGCINFRNIKNKQIDCTELYDKYIYYRKNINDKDNG